MFEWRKSVHYWWSCISFAPECKELTCMLDPLLYRWGVPPVVIRWVHWTMQRRVLQTWITPESWSNDLWNIAMKPAVACHITIMSSSCMVFRLLTTRGKIVVKQDYTHLGQAEFPSDSSIHTQGLKLKKFGQILHAQCIYITLWYVSFMIINFCTRCKAMLP